MNVADVGKEREWEIGGRARDLSRAIILNLAGALAVELSESSEPAFSARTFCDAEFVGARERPCRVFKLGTADVDDDLTKPVKGSGIAR